MAKHEQALPLLQDRLIYLERSIARAEQQVTLRRNQVGDPTRSESQINTAQRLLDQAESDRDIAQERFDNLSETVALLKEDK